MSMKTNTQNTQRGLPGRQAGFTLIETLAAISLITIAIIAPMALTVQSLESAYYARDQITASNLAQEGIEAVRSIRDGNILATARGTATPLFQGIIPTGQTNATFVIDAHTIPAALTPCAASPGACSTSETTLQTNGQLYGYGSQSQLCPNPASGWTCTNFRRSASASVVWSDSGGNAQEIQVIVTVSWQTAAYKTQSVTLSENLYNWVNPGTGG